MEKRIQPLRESSFVQCSAGKVHSWHWDHLLDGLDKASHRCNLHEGPLISRYSNSLEIHMIRSITKIPSTSFFFYHLNVIKWKFLRLYPWIWISKLDTVLLWKYCKMKNPFVPIVIVGVTKLHMGSFVPLFVFSNTKEQLSVAERTGMCLLMLFLTWSPPQSPCHLQKLRTSPCTKWSPLPVLLPASTMPGTMVSLPKKWAALSVFLYRRASH